MRDYTSFFEVSVLWNCKFIACQSLEFWFSGRNVLGFRLFFFEDLGDSNSHDVLLHEAERIFPPRTLHRSSNVMKKFNVQVKKNSWESLSVASQTDTKALLQILDVEFHSSTRFKAVLEIYDSDCSHSHISERTDAKINVQGTATKLTILWTVSQQVRDTQNVQVKLTAIHSCDTLGSMCGVKP